MIVAQTLPLATNWSMHGDGGMGTGWGILMVVGWVLLWVAIIAIPALLLVATVRGWSSRRQDTPTAILDRRFAEGAISFEDYEQRKRQFAQQDPRQTEPSDAPPPAAVGAT